MNTGAAWPELKEAESRVHRMQMKLHRWATADPGRRFDDLYNLVYDPSFLVVAWNRVRRNTGARSAGVDGVRPRSIGQRSEKMLEELRDDLKARRFQPAAVREKMIPKANGKLRRLGIPTISTYSGVAPALFRFAGGHASIPPVEGPAVEHSVRAQASRWPAVRVCGRSPGHDRLASGLDQPG